MPGRGCLLAFFSQAEDGIRDGHVTGVQTCALPICGPRPRAEYQVSSTRPSSVRVASPTPQARREVRSEERRVGKGSRCLLSRPPYNELEQGGSDTDCPPRTHNPATDRTPTHNE